MNKAQLFDKYPYIVAWGKMMGSYGYYIEAQCQKALDEKAPDDACCYANQKWDTYSQMRQELKETLDAYKNGTKGGAIFG